VEVGVVFLAEAADLAVAVSVALVAGALAVVVQAEAGED
jgi:hypothetical protein